MKRIRILRRGGQVVAALVGLTLLAGCFFSPRDPEPPGTGEQIDYLPQSSPQNVWANLELSLENTHTAGWENNISKVEFIYRPDDEAEGQFPGVFEGWDRGREVNFINNFYNSGVTIIAKMKNDEFEVPGTSGSEVRWEGIIYDLVVTNDADGSTVRYRGSADITFRLDDNFWYVYLWEDRNGESAPGGGPIFSTMGVLRGTFGSN